MAGITNAELAQMRDDIESLLPDTGNILSKSLSSDGEGGWVETWGTATANVSCRLDSFTSKTSSRFQGDEILMGGAVQSYGRWTLTLPHGTSIGVENRFEGNGRTFNVIATDNGKSWSPNVRAILEQL